MTKDPYRYFRPEARSLLDQFAQAILEIERREGGVGVVQRLLRLAHTLKGAARVVGQSTIAERAHAIEDSLAPFRDRAEAIARENIDAILVHLDEIGSQIVTLAPAVDGADAEDGKIVCAKPSNNKPAISNTAVISTNAAWDVPRAIRADIADMDAVIDGVTETRARLNGLRRSTVEIEQVSHLANLLRAQLAPRGAADRSNSPGVGANQAIATADELRRKFGGFARDFETAVTRVDRELRQLRDAAESLRLIAVGDLFTALERTARDAARSLSKNVSFEGRGGDIRLDANVLGIIQGALIQIIRNAVAHGIETEGERFTAGKSATGRVSVSVSRRGPKILFECRDDGRGIDLAAVRRVAAERGLLGANPNELSADDLVAVLLRGGVSTSEVVTDISGRGVGLDVVREALEQLGGEVHISIDPGRGTTFELLIPRSITSVPSLIVEAEQGACAIAIPLDGVRKVLRLASGDIACAAGSASIQYEQKAIPFVPVAAALDGVYWSADRAWIAVIVIGAKGVAAIGVERLLGATRTVVRPLPDRLKKSAIVVGASLDSEGDPQLFLDPDSLVSTAHGARAAEHRAVPAKTPVLIVDDSLTTRMLEKSILESAGYDVDVASSGEEGLDLARRKPFSLILCDVEMPGIDGFTFVERIRSDAALRDIPAILVSSRAAPEDRQRGRDVGAHGYIVKSEFNQAELLTMIRPMVG